MKVALLMDYEVVSSPERLEQAISFAKSLGKLTTARLYLSERELPRAKDVLNKASRLGVDTVVELVAKHVRLAIELVELAYQGSEKVLVVAATDKLVPALSEARAKKRVILITWEEPTPELRSAVDEIKKFS